MLERFIVNLIDGFVYMFMWIIVILIITATALPIVLILCHGGSAWLMLWYLFIIPFDYSIWQTFF